MSYKLLIVEDEMIIRRGLICSMDWESLDIDIVLEAASGLEAMEQIRTQDPDIVIMDINIPFISGLEVLEQTRNQCDYSAIILTGYADFDFARRAVSLEAVRFLLKPVDFTALAEAIEDAKISRQRRLAYHTYRTEKLSEQNLQLLPTDRLNEPKSEAVQKILHRIETDYGSKLTLRELARELHYSETFLIRKFKEEMEMGFNEYLNRYRLQKAVTLLTESGKQTYAIAEECGFLNAKYFGIVFRKYIGCSPKEFLHINR